MDRLSKALRKAMSMGRFKTSVTLSDSNYPGEGEHKILPKIRILAQRAEDADKTVVIYSPDGDMISLGLLTQKSNLYILRYVDPHSEHENILLEKGFDFTVCVALSPEQQLARLEERGIPRALAGRRISKQLPLAQKIDRSDFVLWNEGSPEFLEAQVDRMVRGLAAA